MNFRDLVEREAGYKDPTRRPRPMTVMAERCGVSRPHLYNLFNGLKTAPPWTVARIAKGLGSTAEVVEKALNRSRIEALTS